MELLEAARNGAAKPALAIVSQVFGIGATLAVNMAAEWYPDVAGDLDAALSALVLSLLGDAKLFGPPFPRAEPVPVTAALDHCLATAHTMWL